MRRHRSASRDSGDERRLLRPRPWVASITALALAFTSAVFGVAIPAAAADGDVEIVKSASVSTVAPGQDFTYTIAVSCTSISTGCRDAVLTDSVPPPFVVNSALIGPGLTGTVDIAGQDVSVTFTMPTSGGGIGLPGATYGIVTISVSTPDPLPYELNGTTVTNTATSDASTQTSGPLSSSADVVMNVPLLLDVDTAKTIDPPVAVADAGQPVTATVSATNTSNAAVDEIVLVDPADPEAAGNPFDTLPFTGLGDVEYPEGAETVIVDVWDGDSWEPYATGTAPAQPTVSTDVPDADVRGVRITFADADGSGIPAGETGSAELALEHPDDVQELPDTIVTNTVEGTVTLGDESESTTASDTHEIVAEAIDVIADKSFDPVEVAAGDTSTATITAGNDSAFDLPSLTVTEPALPASGDYGADGFDESMQFVGFDGGVAWPAGATGATITYYDENGDAEGPTPFANGAVPQAPADPDAVVRFEIVFTGDIDTGAQTEIPFDVSTDPDEEGSPATITNVATVTGEGPAGGRASEDADALLRVYEEQLETITTKSIYPDEVLQRPGEWVLVDLGTQIAPFPDSTMDAEVVVIQDPVAPTPGAPVVDGSFWDVFDATAISGTAVPPGTTLTINYWNGDEWVPLRDARGAPVVVEGEAVFTMAIPEAEQERIEGLQFIYTADPGETVPDNLAPRFTGEVRETERNPATTTSPTEGDPVAVENCAASQATADDVESAPAQGCASVDLDFWDADGDGTDILDKSISTNGGDKDVIARSQENIRAHLRWSTGGLSDVETMTIQDELDPPAYAVGGTDERAGSFYDAFDLVDVDIDDPYFAYDQIASIDIWDGANWTSIATTPAADDFPVRLTLPQREAALGARIVYVENPDRVGPTPDDPNAPPIGSGVARSIGNDREVTLHLRLRDTRRSDGAPVMGGLDYNFVDSSPAVGTVLNVASATGETDGDVVAENGGCNAEIPLVGTCDTVVITDEPLNVSLDKSWSNSPFGVPSTAVDQDAFPTGRVTLTASNDGAMYVDRLQIIDTAAETFESFDVLDFRSIDAPTGATSTSVVVDLDSDADGAPDDTQSLSADEALSLDREVPGDLAFMAQIVGFRVVFDGRIAPAAEARVVLDVRLRETSRTTGVELDPNDASTYPSSVTNIATAEVSDAGYDDAVTSDPATAVVDLRVLDLDVEAGKSFSPAAGSGYPAEDGAQTEPDDAVVTMNLSVQPTGSARTGVTRITDAPGTFWNAYDFVGIDPSFAFAEPINRVRVDVYTGATFNGDPGDADLDVDGGNWVNGPIVTELVDPANYLPTGIDLDDVQGIRLTFAQFDEDNELVQWENPTNPLQEVPVLVQRRDTLRSLDVDGETVAVPSDRADLAPAPGETQPGTFSNSTTVWVCAVLDTGCADGETVTENVRSDTATAAMHYLHLASEVTIEKSTFAANDAARDQFGPGEVITYRIEVENTGQYPIENPIIVDTPPGTDLLLNPDAGAAGPFRYAASTPAQTTGPAMPTDPDQVDVDYSTASGPFTFTFPEQGTRLEVGQTYTIDIDMIIAPGVPAGDKLENTATIQGDRPFDQCNTTTPADPEAPCAATADVTVLAAGAARSGKLVRITDPADQVGLFDDLDPTETCNTVTDPRLDPEGEGFYAYACTPAVVPGGSITWRLAIANTGNIPMDELVLVDRIPTPGDTGAISTVQRESEWTPVFEPGSIEIVSPTVGSDAWSYEVTTSDSLCIADLADPGVPACADGDWVPVGTVDAADITATQLRVSLAGDPLEPGEILLVDGRTFAPAIADDPTPGDPYSEADLAARGENPIAWNTVATGARLTRAQSDETTSIRPIEGAKVGAALATGSLDLLKTLSGDGEDFAPETIEVTLSCVSAGTTFEVGPFDLTPGETYRVDNLPLGASCGLEEGEGNGETSLGVSTSGTVGEIGDAGTATLENVYDLARLAITKTVETEAGGATGDVPDAGDFTFEVSCTFLGEAVLASGYTATPMIVELAHGETETLTGLPAGASCIVAETDARAASSTTLASDDADGETPAAEISEIEVVLAPEGDGAAPVINTVDAVNTYDVGELALTKQIEPIDAPSAAGEGPYVVAVTCVRGDPDAGGVVTWDGEVEIVAGETVTIENIVAGSVCRIVETDTGYATSTTISDDEVTIAANDTISVTVTNAYAEGSLTVTKVIEGDAQWASPSFEVTLVCLDFTSTMVRVEIPGGAVRTLEAPTWSTTYERLPAGAFCLLTETRTGGAVSSMIVDGSGQPAGGFFSIVADTALEFEVVNTFTVGSLVVEKLLEGEPAASLDPATTDTYTVELTCTREVNGAMVAVDIPGGAVRVVTGAGQARYEGLPTGAVCTVAETDDGFATGSEISPSTPVVIGEGDAELVTVEVTNTFDNGSIELLKKVETQDGFPVPTEFTATVTCTWQGAAVPLAGDGVVTLTPGATVTVPDVPVGSECAVSEADAGQTEVTISPEEFTVTDAAAPVEIEIINTYGPGGFEVLKAVDNGGAVDSEGDPIAYTRTYSFTAQCTFLGQPALDEVFTLLDGGVWVSPDVPAGAECAVTETDAAGAASSTIEVVTSGTSAGVLDGTTASFVVPEYADGSTDPLVAVELVNAYTVGAVEVTKTIDGAGGEAWGAAEFTVDMVCTLDGTSPDPVFEGQAVLSAATSLVWTVDDLPTGAECVVTESETGGANATSDPVTVTVGNDPTVPVAAEVVNTFTTGPVVVEKLLEGEPAASLDPATTDTYTVELTCTREVNGETVAVEIPGGAVRTITGAGQARYDALPTGAECTVEETDDGFATGSEVSPSTPVVIGEGEAEVVTVEVTNTFDNGSIELVKTVDAPDGFPVPAEFTATVTCTWQGADVPLADGGVVTLTADAPVTVAGVPVGSECSVAEADAGQTEVTITPEEFTVTDITTPVDVTIENTYEWASLEVRKNVISSTGSIPTGFEFHVVCTFQGEVVVDETFFLNADETETITGIPARSTCVITETDDRDAAATLPRPVVPGVGGDLAPVVDLAERSVVIPEVQPDSTAEIAVVTFVNFYGTGQAAITKEFAGAGAAQYGVDKTFTLDYVCTYSGEVVLEGSVDLNADNGFMSAVTDLVVGTECTVTEPDLNGADAVVFRPNDGEDTTSSTVTVEPGGELITVTATNWYLTGSLEVTKTLAGDGAEQYGTDDFELRLLCAREGEFVDIPGGRNRTVNAGSPTALWENLPTGSRCILTETDDGGANETQILDSDGEVVAGGTGGAVFTVTTDPTILSVEDQPQPGYTVENTFNLAQVSVTKTVAPTTAVDINGDPVAYGPFQVQLVCTWNGQDVMAVEPMTQTIADGETITWTGLPEEAECSVTETDTMDAASTTVSVTQGGATSDPVEGTTAELEPLPNVDSEDQTSVALVNEYLDPPITVTKVVDGTGAADFGDRTFTFYVRCVLIDASHPAPGLLLRDAEYEVGGPIGPLTTLLPTGAECTITEVDTGGADATTITVDGVPLTGTTVTTVMGTVPVEITVTNTFDAPLPSTGGNATTAIVVGVAGALVLVAGAVLMVVVRRRRHHH